MTLHEYATALLKHWLVIVVLALLGAAAGYGVSQFMDERYRSETTVMISPARGDSTSELVQGSNYVQSVVQTYAVLARSPVVLQPVIDELGLDETATRLAARTDVEAPLNTMVIEIGVTDATADAAQAAADAIAAEFADAVAETSPEGADGQPAVRVSVISPARAPLSAIAPNTRMNTVLGGAAGLALGVLAALALRRFGGRLGSLDDLDEAVDAPVLGAIGRASGGVVEALREHPAGRVAESVRQTTAALKFVDMDHEHRVLIVTSAGAGEGKSSTCVGLALTLAEVGSRVLLVEADLRRPTIARMTGIEGAVGLTTVLVGDATLAEAAQSWGHERLHVLPSGPKPPNAGQLLTSARLRAVLDQARADYEYVIIDTPPVGAVSDALWLAPAADAAILVARADRTRRDALRRAIAAIDGTPAPVLGVVLNGVALARGPYDQREG
ncbi:polysaccharide biosynthesis tyrosine autokinase [Agrococcus sp. ARC_14]|uniref:polysaccharide biosynthesis tyrosine autokinase n=1 Tax=Agrococcus sp. ARC_14 TaxID=2919927 RepID=UPI001F053CE2|nr:polysaccharide biosynthesis tyrosine autokinase [Agrococcus sp. ARC_14]MCH1882713.1 polysaccharide biosynthesis tyrosine autokinase [Agrococcus sp. ARC_14]